MLLVPLELSRTVSTLIALKEGEASIKRKGNTDEEEDTPVQQIRLIILY
jgi:hypothetical protein